MSQIPNQVDLNPNINYCIVRPYAGEKTLIIGCGKSPFDYIEWGCVDEHVHNDVYTIDINLRMNPCVIGDIDNLDLLFIPDNSFDEIIFEGLWCPINKQLFKEIERIRSTTSYVHGECKGVNTRRVNGCWVGKCYDYEDVLLHGIY